MVAHHVVRQNAHHPALVRVVARDVAAQQRRLGHVDPDPPRIAARRELIGDVAARRIERDGLDRQRGVPAHDLDRLDRSPATRCRCAGCRGARSRDRAPRRTGRGRAASGTRAGATRRTHRAGRARRAGGGTACPPAMGPAGRCPAMLAAPPSTDAAIASIASWRSSTSVSMSGVIRVAPAGIRLGGTTTSRSSVDTRAASSARVCAVNSARTSLCRPSRRIRSSRLTASSEWPPSSKKLSWRPTRSCLSSRAHSAARRSSIGPCGGSYDRRAYDAPSGAGSALRSSLPLGVSGSAASCTYAAGTM